ncbi:MAG: ABC transporter ATP-binding protein [Deltaproteobacteria bacterium]|nr:ABC transporter ATP-binding protein [Deltaproteobacteria bacterium]MBW2063911.1 ABC transporter ATP-binding protein [Deltaproteobacteria bacterium]
MVLLLGMTLTATLFEGFGVAMLFPVMDYIEKGRDFLELAKESRMWLYIDTIFSIFSIPKNLISLMVLVFLLLIVRQLFNYLRTVYSTWITEAIFADIRGEGFRWFVRADMPFYDIHGIGELVNVLTVDGIRAGSGIFTFFNLLAASMIFVLYFIFLLFLSPGMTLFAMGIMGCVGLVLKSRITRSGEIGLEVSKYNDKISASVVERLNGIRLIKLSATEEEEIRSIRGFSEKIRENTYKLARIRARMEFTVDPMVILAGLTILYLSSEVFHMTLAKTGIFIFILLRLMPYTKDMFNSRQALAGFSGSLFRVTSLLDRARGSEVIRGGKVASFKLEKGIRFENVSFAYDQRSDFALKNINIWIAAGRMTALIGRSGAGKSTLVDLIPRLRVPSEGRITVDSQPIEEFDLKILRRSIAFVSQEGFLFNDTIENNIKYCRPDANMDDVARAAAMAYAEGFIREFPEGYETVVGERGVKLSGGQKQRIILARALLQQASIIILDEPTTALDSESEVYIQKAMEGLRARGGITMIVIAHRLSTIRSADQIIVLDRGRVIECGSPSELMHEDTWYADMVRMQTISEY